MKTEDPLRETCGSSSPLPPLPTCWRRSPFRFIGGAVGYISYDSVRYWERLPAKAKDDLSFPDMEFGIYTDGIVFDHLKQGHPLLLAGPREQAQAGRVPLAGGALPRSAASLTAPAGAKPNVEKERFEAMVETAKKHITARRHLPGRPLEALRL